MRIYRTIAWYLIASLLVLAGATVASLSASRNSQSNQSQCVLCHTDVKGLIQLSWEVEKVKSKPARSAETAGEG